MQQLGDLVVRKKVPAELLGGERDHCISVQSDENVGTRMLYFKDCHCPSVVVILNHR